MESLKLVIEQCERELSLEEGQHWAITLDCAPQHCAREFIEYVSHEKPLLHLIMSRNAPRATINQLIEATCAPLRVP
eukprot:4531249-Amphidinium_carterae.2